MKYRTNPLVVDAIRMTSGTYPWQAPPVNVEGLGWPDWLQAAWNKHPSEVGAFGVDRLTRCRTRIVLNTLQDVREVKLGDWIVRDAWGRLDVVKDNIFRLMYEPVEQARRRIEGVPLPLGAGAPWPS